MLTCIKFHQEENRYAPLPCDVYNMDETGLFYCLTPNSTSATGSVRGTKKCKDRLTITLCANADGSHKCKPLVIGKSKKPRCFGSHFDPSVYRMRSNFRGLKLLRISQIRCFRVFIFAGPHPVPLFFCSN